MIGLGFVGCGDVAFRTYFPGLEPLAGRARVVACFDERPERREAAAADFDGARAVATLDELIAADGVDAVVNLTPAPVHAEVTAKALEAGHHVYSEKPLAMTLREADELIGLAEARGKLLLCAPAVNATVRFRWLREVLETGRIGRPTLGMAMFATMGPAAWREYTGDPSVHYTAGVGPLLDLGVYVLHGLTGLLGPARRVESFSGIAIPQRDVVIDRLAGERITVTEDDQVLIHLAWDDGILAQVATTFTVADTRLPALELHGTRGALSISRRSWFDGSGPVEVVDAKNGWETLSPPQDSPYAHLIMAGIAHFVDCLEGVEAPILTAAHARHVLEIALGAGRSAREGRAVDLQTTF